MSMFNFGLTLALPIPGKKSIVNYLHSYQSILMTHLLHVLYESIQALSCTLMNRYHIIYMLLVFR